jgi:hypothetical protein
LAFGFLIFQSRFPRRWSIMIGLSSINVLLIAAFSNNRLRQSFLNLLHGQSGNEFAYRWINATVGWRMGSHHPFTGIGLGNVPLAYQKYRPVWAGQESEMIYQLHSTPVQLFAEMGIWGILVMVGAIAWSIYSLIRYRSTNTTDSILRWSLAGGLLAYLVMSLTDYQLDNMAISGTLVIYFACLASSSGTQTKIPHPMPIFYTVLGLMIAAIVWLSPVHRAWQLSNQAFSALSQERVDVFIPLLTQAEKLAPWEPYYPYQLGWNLGDFALQTQNPQHRQQLLAQSITWFNRGNIASPYQEFGRSNLGWLLLNQNPAEATQAFSQSIQLVPAKPGNFYGLGLSLLRQNQIESAIDAIALEAIRHPLFITSPIWRSPGLQPLYRPVIAKMFTIYSHLLKNTPSEALKTHLHQSRGGLAWWLGDYSQAHQDWDRQGTTLSRNLLALAEGKPVENLSPKSSLSLLLQAFKNPTERIDLLKRAWIAETEEDLPTSVEQQLLGSMANSQNLTQWLTQNPPILQYRIRRVGFGVNSRHIDGIQPSDFWPVVENLALNTWFGEILPDPKYFPEFDLALQSLYQELEPLKDSRQL